jgi:hypothetical protein
MSQENVEIVKRVYEVLAQGVDEHALPSLVAAGLASPDAELDLSTALEARGAHLITMHDGRVVRTESYTDRAKALAAAGLPE